MKKAFKCVSSAGYHLTQGKIYDIDFGEKPLIGVSVSTIRNDLGVVHFISTDEIKCLFVDLEEWRQERLKEIGI
jgi:predicted transcriptional regulator